MPSEPVATPALVIDLAVVERNLSRMAEYAASHGLTLRPHAKTHKSLRLGRRQLELGALGLTVAKVGEAEVMAEVCSDLLIAYPAFDDARRHRIAALTRVATVRVALDSLEGVAALADAAAGAESRVGVLVDLDVGNGRTGVQSTQAVVAMARAVERCGALRFDGLFCYPGHIRSRPAEQGVVLGEVNRLLEEAVAGLESAGLPPGVVSGGSTPTAWSSHLVSRLTEVRPGTYIFNDMSTVVGGYCSLADCAAQVICTVVSEAVPGKVVIDAGSKALAADRNAIEPDAGYGWVVEYPKARIVRLSEEHGEVDVSRCEHRPRLGERVGVIPNHICPCVNLVDQAWLRTESEGLEPLRVDARGRVS